MNNKMLATEIIKNAQQANRYLVAIAGPPASGKSTLAKKLADAINQQQGQNISVVVPMDGFHLDNTTLDQRGLRERKGAPETFDAVGFVELINTLKTANTDVAIPLFDRAQDAVIPNAQTITPQQKVL